DLDSKFRYSDVIVVKVKNEEQRLMLYPNPVARELRITIPDSWQNKTVNYKLFNSNGVLMRQLLSVNAGQTETMQVADLAAGVYIIQTATGKETAVQKFIKTNS
ncbi:MAG TPA: T9SS type A sorting domain-containing protein, partial [Puia sp.]